MGCEKVVGIKDSETPYMINFEGVNPDGSLEPRAGARLRHSIYEAIEIAKATGKPQKFFFACEIAVDASSNATAIEEQYQRALRGMGLID